MQVFITGTDTNVGKTLVASWLCLHFQYKYFKPIQTGTTTDSDFISLFINRENIYKEQYLYQQPVAPYLAAALNKDSISLQKIILPLTPNLIVEGAGGLLVPLNRTAFIIDLIQYLNIPVIIVAKTQLGTINHTLLSLKLLNMYKIKCLGVILSGNPNKENKLAIENYGNIKVIAELPFLKTIDKNTLLNIPVSKELKKLLT